MLSYKKTLEKFLKAFLVVFLLTPVLAFSQETTISFDFTSSTETWIVPPCVTTIDITAAGAEGGGSYGGNGALVTGTFNVTPGDVLEIKVGGAGSCPNGGFNGGANGASANNSSNGGCGGGGASDVRVANYQLADRIIVAAGGGGMGGGSTDANGGDGGCTNGETGDSPFGEGGGGATQSNGGIAGPPWINNGNSGEVGSLANGGNGATDPCYNLGPGGGGGGGYYGGGGGGSDCFGFTPLGGGAGGGGSSLFPTNGSCTQGSNSGNGYVTISYTLLETSGYTSITVCDEYDWNGQIITISGEYEQTFTSTAGCDSTHTLNATINTTPIIDAGLDFAICGLETNLNGTSSVSTNTWSANDVTFTNSNNLTTEVIANNYGNQTIILNAEDNGCSATPDEVNITFLEAPIADAGSDIDICSGETVQLNGYANGNILWSPNTGLNDPTIPNPTVSGITDSILYTLTITEATGLCNSTDEVWVNVQPIIEAIDQTPSVCEAEFNTGEAEVNLTALEASLSSSSTATVNWYSDANLSSPISNPSNFTVANNQYVFAELNAPQYCSNNAVVSYNINPMPEANSVSADFCEDLVSGILVDLTSFENQITTGSSVSWINNLGNPINNTNSYPLTGSTTLFSQVTNSFGCENEAPLSLQLNTTPYISAITSDDICQSENYNLASISITDNNNASGYISFHSGSPANTGNQVSNLVNPSSTSLYYILSTTNNGCKDEIPFNLIVHPAPTPDAGIDNATCGLSYPLNASQTSGTTANWQTISDATINEVNNPNSSVSVTDYGTYSFVWEETSSFGCYNNSTVNILFVPSPTSSSIENITICPGEEVFLDASSENYTSTSWTTSGTGYFLDYQSNSTTYTPSDLDISNNGASLTFTAVNSPCPNSTANVTVEIHNTPTSNISGEGDLCNNVDSTATLTFISTGIPPYTLSIQQNGEEWVEHTTHSLVDTIIVSQEGFYEIAAVSDSNCEGTTTGSVSVFKRPVPYAQFTTNPSVAYLGDAEIVFYNNSQLADEFSWNFGDSTYNELDYNPIHNYTDTGVFQISLQISNEFGCTDSVTHTIIIHPNFHFYLPNAFTPNGDNENDTFIGKGEGIADYQMTIFNRWGAAIFYSNSIEEGWDGVPKSASEISPNGVYSYKIDVTDLLGKKHTYTGEVSLLR